jgi:glycosyltransferase involved in cell wall biosynthesis
MVKNEEDIIEMTLRHFLAEGLDEVRVYDNLSSDRTFEILMSLDGYFANLEIYPDTEVAYYQEQKMNRWIRDAAEDGAEWIVPFDADEIWYSPSGKSLKDTIEELNADVISCPVYDMIPSLDTNTTRPSRDILWRSTVPEIHPVVGFRYNPEVHLLQGNHYVQNAGHKYSGGITVCHFQYRSFEQYKRKLRNGKAVYDATDLDYGIGQHWRDGGVLSDEALEVQWQHYCSQPNVDLNPCYPKGQI